MHVAGLPLLMPLLFDLEDGAARVTRARQRVRDCCGRASTLGHRISRAVGLGAKGVGPDFVAFVEIAAATASSGRAWLTDAARRAGSERDVPRYRLVLDCAAALNVAGGSFTISKKARTRDK